MRVCMSMLYDGLNRHFDCEIGTCYDPDTTARFIHKTAPVVTKTADEGVFLAAEADIRNLPPCYPPCNLIVVSNSIPVDMPCALFVRTDLDLKKVVAYAEESILSYQAWSDKLFDLMIAEAGLQTLVDQAHEILGNPITVFDQSLRVLAYSENDIMNDTLWVSDDSSGSIDYSEIGEQAVSSFLGELLVKKELFEYPTVHENDMSACLVCASDMDLIGTCLVHKNKRISQGDFACLRYFSEVLSLAIKTQYSKWNDSVGGYDALVLDAMEGRIKDETELNRRTSLLGMSLDEAFEVIVVRSRKGFLNDAQIQSVRAMMKDIIFGGHVITYHREVVAILSYKKDKLPIEADLTLFRKQLGSSRLVAGISGRSSSFLDLDKLYTQASFAISIGRKMYRSESAVKFEACRRYYLYECSYQRGDWGFYLHPAFNILWEHDAKSSNQLFPTLSCLLKNDGRRSETAKELFIQRNTLQYRIEKIEKLCNIELSQSETFNHLKSSLELYEYCCCCD